MSWTLPSAVLFLLVLLLLMGYFLSRKVFPAGSEGPGPAEGERLPDCESCGQEGCGGFAKKLVRGSGDLAPAPLPRADDAPPCSACASQPQRPPAVVAIARCIGTGAALRYRYAGAPTCRAAAALHLLPKACDRACLGFGDCLNACASHAIALSDGIARVDPNRCTGCGDCVDACPVGVFELLPAGAPLGIACRNVRADEEREDCPQGCTACGRCVEACPEKALELDETGLPRLLPERCSACGACIEACPRGLPIVTSSLPGQHEPAARRSRF